MTTSTLPTTSTYINISSLTSPTFTPHTYANELVRSVNTTSANTNTPSDALVDLTTPLQKTLFDLQEIDTSIHTLTSRSALDILSYTQAQNATAQRILGRVEEERVRLVGDFERLHGEVLGRYERAERARLYSERSLRLVRISKSVQRVVGLARGFEGVLGESGLGVVTAGKEGHGKLVEAANVVLEFRELMSGADAAELGKVNLVKQIRGRIFEDGEARVLDWARRVVREFSVSGLVGVGSTYKEAEETKGRFTNAVHVLWLLSPAPRLEGRRKMRREEFEGEYLVRVLQGYLQSAVMSSAGGIGKGLGQLPGLERALLEASARCQNVIAFEVLLGGIRPPEHLLLEGREKKRRRRRRKNGKEDDEMEDFEDESEELDVEDEEDGSEENLLEPLLSALDTSSLASYFWRSLASSLTPKVQEIINRGGVSVRTLRSNKDAVRSEIRDCVLRGSRMPATLMGHGMSGKEEVVGNWEREAAVMVGSVLGPLNR